MGFFDKIEDVNYDNGFKFTRKQRNICCEYR